MIVKKAWIMKHRTASGSWTKPQVEALGVTWPPSKGWMARAVGVVITDEQADIFRSKITVKGIEDRNKSPAKYDMALAKCQENQIRILKNSLFVG
mgnify:FL=1